MAQTAVDQFEIQELTVVLSKFSNLSNLTWNMYKFEYLDHLNHKLFQKTMCTLIELELSFASSYPTKHTKSQKIELLYWPKMTAENICLKPHELIIPEVKSPFANSVDLDFH